MQLISSANITNFNATSGSAQWSATDLVSRSLFTTGYNYHILLVGNLATSVTAAYVTVNNSNVGEVQLGLLSCGATCQVLNIGGATDFLTGGFGDVSSVQVTVQALAVPISQQLVNLAATVTSFNLKQGISNSLDAKLANVVSALDEVTDHDKSSAVNKLQAFINEVNAQRSKAITPAQADQLIATANGIISQLTQ
jgi:hypothetical protein